MTRPAPFLLTFVAAMAGSALLIASWPKPAATPPEATGLATAQADRIEDLERRLERITEDHRRFETRLEQVITERTSVILATRAAEGRVEEAVAEAAGPELAEVAVPESRARSPKDVFAALRKGDLDEAGRGRLWAELKAAGKMDEVVAMFEALARQSPQDADVQSQLGQVYLQRLFHSNPGPEQGVFGTKADKAFLAALKIDPEHYEARFSRATSLSFWPDLFGKKPEAIREYETLIAQQEAKGYFPPGHAQAYVFLGNLYEQTGKADLAREIRQRGARVYPDHQELKDRLAR